MKVQLKFYQLMVIYVIFFNWERGMADFPIPLLQLHECEKNIQLKSMSLKELNLLNKSDPLTFQVYKNGVRLR